MRGIFEDSTRAFGSSLALDKSEVIVPSRFLKHGIDKAKDEFIWLGFSLKWITPGKLNFTTKKINGKRLKIDKFLQDILNVLHPISIRRIFFRTYIEPVIEFFAFCLDISKNLKTYYHGWLTKITKMPRSTSHAKLAAKFGVRSFEQIQKNVVNQIWEINDILHLKQTRIIFDNENARELRSKSRVFRIPEDGLQDFFYKASLLNYNYGELELKAEKFCPDTCEAWMRSARRGIKKHCEQNPTDDIS